MSRKSTSLLTIQLGIPEVSRTFSHAVRKDGTELLIDPAGYRGIRDSPKVGGRGPFEKVP